MKAQINQVGILTNQFDDMVAFYRDVMGFQVLFQAESHVEFESPGVRFAISALEIMSKHTGHSSFSEKKKGQSFELAFSVESPAEVDEAYEQLVQAGATPIQSASDMPWNQRTAFFADPDGNIHEVFADLPAAN